MKTPRRSNDSTPGACGILETDIQELQRANLEAEEQRSRLQAILNTTVDAIVSIDENGIIEMANPATAAMFGWRVDEMVGQNVSILMPRPHHDLHDSYIRNYLTTGVRKVIGIGREVMAMRRDGTIFPIDLALSETAFAEHRHFTAIMRDATDRRLAEQELDATLLKLKKSNDYLHAVLNQMQVGTILVDENGVVDYHTRKCEPLLARKVGPETQLSLADFFRVEDRMLQSISEMMGRPEAARGRMQVHLPFAKGMRWFEIDIRDDAEDQARRIIYLYDIDEMVSLRRSIRADRYGPIIGRSEAIRDMMRLVDRVAAGEWTVMIEGETGSGKELAARAIHEASPRKSGPFIAVNCAGLADSLLTSQLFGHKKGSFTGAVSDQEGFFEAAGGGTLFLDEIGDISPQLQATLLRVLQEREILRVGDTRPRKTDARVMVATNRDLQAEVDAGRFRQDLLYRIRVARIMVPPLRDRREDIPLLAGHFFDINATQDAGRKVRGISPAAMAHLVAHDWPGNVRELKGVIDYAWIHAGSDTILPVDLPAEIFRSTRPASPNVTNGGDERSEIILALQKAGQNRNRAAEILQVSRATLFRRLKKYGING